ncbi:MAG: TrmH family RNA methyltransferase [Akkermansiaceae bacterium]
MINWHEILQKRETQTHFVVEGRHGVERLLASSFITEKVIEIGADITRDEVSELLGFRFHRSHLAIAQKPTVPPLSDFSSGPLVVLPEIADPGNLGTIIRNTAALGGAGVLLGKGASPFNAKAVRASAGSIFSTPIHQSSNLLADLNQLKKERILVGTSLSKNSKPLTAGLTFEQSIALLLGPEDFGLSHEIECLCDHLFHLPMARKVDSLNVASASAIFLHSFQ